jgi:hypothetical protein
LTTAEQLRQFRRLEEASPGAARKITKLSVIARKIVTSANAVRLRT